jgi:hypothetical protein
MSSRNPLRIVVQGGGLYLLLNCFMTVASAISRIVTVRFMESNGIADMKWLLIENCLYSALLLAPAWVLLAKTDWCVREISNLSRSEVEEVEDDRV